MLRAHTVDQVRQAEAALMARLPEGTLMQRAAAGLAHAVLDLLGGGYGSRALLFVGSGDNGGDALWAGARLAKRGVRVEALLLSDQAHAEGCAAVAAAGGFLTRDASLLHSDPDVVVDGIVGIGGTPGLRPAAAEVLDGFADIPVVAVDVPSGVEVDTGRVDGAHVTADVTVTFGTHKIAHLVGPAAAASGATHLVDIGLDLPEPTVEALQPDDVAALLPAPAWDGHKYTRGVVGVRAGSAAYPGAAVLATAGANTGLAGMVRFVGDAAVDAAVRAAHPEVVGAGQVQAWVVGSGGGDDAAAMLSAAREDGVPLVVDADALAHLPDRITGAVLTPHAGELAAMTGTPRTDIEADPLSHAQRAAQRLDAVVLLKGPRTVIASPGAPARVNLTGNPWLATAGAGDVLAGLIGALLAAGLDARDAASVGAWVHGAAATSASGSGPLTASRVCEEIPQVLRALGRRMEQSRA